MEREFRETEAFTRLVKSKALTDEQLRQLQRDIISGLGKTIPRTGGFKKIRLTGGQSRGKRGGWRVIYADYPNYGFTAIVFAYPKGLQETLTPEQEKRLRNVKAVLDAEVKKKYGKSKEKK